MASVGPSEASPRALVQQLLQDNDKLGSAPVVLLVVLADRMLLAWPSQSHDEVQGVHLSSVDLLVELAHVVAALAEVEE